MLIEAYKCSIIQESTYNHITNQNDDRGIKLTKSDSQELINFINLNINKCLLLNQLNKFIKIQALIIKSIAKKKRDILENHIKPKLVFQHEFEHEIGKNIIYSLKDSLTEIMDNKIELFCKNTLIINNSYLKKII
jgi:hypothetical protein